MIKLSFNKYLITLILPIPITYYCYNSNYVWTIINDYDSKRLLEPVWKFKFNKDVNSEVVDTIIDAIESDSSKKYLKFTHYDIYQSGFYPDTEFITNEVKKKIKQNKKINLEKKYNLKFSNIDSYPFNNRIILKLNENINNEMNIDVKFTD